MQENSLDDVKKEIDIVGTTRQQLKSTLFSFLALILILNFSGCSNNFPLSPFEEEMQPSDSTQTSITLDSAQSDIGEITFLELQSSVLQVFQSNSTENILTTEKFIDADSGGIVHLGLDSLGFCMLKFKSGDLNSDQSIEMKWDLTDGKFIFDFGPEGLQFNNPIELKMLYKGAIIDETAEDKLNLFYYNENLQIWQLINGYVDKKNKMYRAELTHFSRYAMAHAQ